MIIVLSTIIKFIIFVLLFALPLATLLTWMERRQSAYSQDRLGPTRAHLFTLFGKPVVLGGLLHPVADALKMFFKESFAPDSSDHALHRVAPLIGFVTALIVLALIPFGPDITIAGHVIPLQIIRLDSGLLFVFAFGSLGVYGAALAGWASNNRFALMGGIRASAQAISYEIALGLTVVGVLMSFGSTELSEIVHAQEGLILGFLPRWGIVLQPFAAILFFVAAMAETKRAPFDLPEGESEIIGYFLEYSSMGFGLFMLGEFIEIVVLSGLFVTLFLGGWQLPWIIGESSVSLGIFAFDLPSWAIGVLGMFIFGAKVFLLCALQIQLRWSLPRFRYDQLMHLGWKILLPCALVNIFVTGILVWADPSLGILAWFGVALMLFFIMVVIAGPRKVSAPEH